MTPASTKSMFEYTGCDAILVARGTMSQPWIAEDIVHHLYGEEPAVRSLAVKAF